MMKIIRNKLSITIVAFLAIFLCGTNVEAATCPYKEKAGILSNASKVKTAYEITERTETMEINVPDSDLIDTQEVVISEFKISIYNITEDLYLVQTNELTKEKINIHYSDTTNGVYTFIDTDLTNVTKYSYKIYGASENCFGETLKSYSFVKPKFNIYSLMSICKGLEDIPCCAPYITKEVGVNEFGLKEEIDKYLTDKKINNEEPEEENRFIAFLKDNYVYIIIGVVLVGGATGITIYFVKKRSAL